MVMNADNGCSPVGYCIGKDFAGVDKTVVEQPYSDCSAVKHLPCTIEGNTDEIFLPLVPNISNDGEQEDILWSCHFYTATMGCTIPPPYLKACHDLGSLGWADSWYQDKIFIMHGILMFLQESADLLCYHADIITFCAPPKDRFHQFLI